MPLPRGKFDIKLAWEIYQSLPEETRSYAEVARQLLAQTGKKVTPHAISERFRRAGLVEKLPRSRPKKKPPVPGRDRTKKWREKKQQSDPKNP